MLDQYCEKQRRIINQLSLYLREYYYKTHMHTDEQYLTPFGGKMTESVGAFPEFILKGTFCKRSVTGLCSPCFYSRFPQSKATRETYLKMVETQLTYITKNFNTLVINHQYGQNSQGISLVLTPTGSFFDEFELPIDLRLVMERQLTKLSEQYGINIFLHIESHCEDFVGYDTSLSAAKEELDYLRKLNARVIFGFESVDEYSRNVLYNKGLSLDTFETAISKAKRCGLIPGAFVFAGLFSLNESQTRADINSTLKYLVDKNVFPVVMFQNVQPYTITDVLLKAEKIHLLEPFTLADIIADMFMIIDGRESFWLIADPIGGPPEPDSHIFKAPRLTDSESSSEIYNALVALRKTRDTKAFEKKTNFIREKVSYCKYADYIKCLPIDLDVTKKNTDQLLNACNRSILQYLAKIGG